jgi:hypothetical protein
MQETPASDIQSVEMAGSAPPPAPAATALPTAPQGSDAPATSAPQKVLPQEWPFRGYDGPQPWESENPPELTQAHLMLSSGADGPEVVQLAALLEYLGYPTNVSAGRNPFAAYDAGVSDAVRQFCADYGIAEDPKVLTARTPDTVGPWIWEALTRVCYKAAAERAEQGS